MDPSCLVTTVQAGGGVMVDVFLGHFRPLSANCTLFKRPIWAWFLTMYIPLWPPYTHPLMAISSRIMHHVTKLKLFQIGFLNMTTSSLY